jgi:polyisoprenoid-binding protein YceI
MSARPGGRRWLRWVIAGVVVLVVLAVGVPFVYIHFIEGPAPAKFSLSASAAPPVGSALTAAQADGKWVIGAGSQAGYRVQEVLGGQNNTAVGRSSHVTGSLQITGTTVASATFSVDLRTVVSDQSQRDDQFNGRIMNTAQFPTATFTLTKPISLGSFPKLNQTISVSAAGTLTMHGVTKPVTVSMQARDNSFALTIVGSIPVVFASWDIANPSFGSFVKTQNHGLVEFSLAAKHS